MRVACAVLLAGCNAVLGVHDFPVTTDARASDAATTDASTTSACIASWLAGTVALDPPQLLDLGATTSDRDPSIAPDDLALYFSSNRGGAGTQGFSIWAAKRDAVTLRFDPPAQVLAPADGAEATKITFSLDELDLVVAQSPISPQQSDLYEATRASTQDSFGALTTANLTALDDASSQYDPALSDDGLRLYYANGSPQQIAIAARPSLDAPFALTGALPAVPGSSDADPDVAAGERVLLFSSTRAGGPGLVDLWYATRPSIGDAFGAAQLIPSVNGASRDNDPSLSHDGCTLYFSSDRGDGVSFLIYSARVTGE